QELRVARGLRRDRRRGHRRREGQPRQEQSRQGQARGQARRGRSEVRRVTLVRRKDGETVPFDEARVVEAVERALAAAGSRDGRLAAEIAGVVGLFLEKTFYDEVPSVEQVEDMVEKVLLETGHA